MERFEFGQSGCQPPNPLITGSSGRGIVNQIKTSRQTDLRGQADLRGWEERAENLVAPSCWLRRKYFPSLPPLRPFSLAHQPSQYNVPGAGGGVPCPSRRSPLPVGSHPWTWRERRRRENPEGTARRAPPRLCPPTFTGPWASRCQGCWAQGQPRWEPRLAGPARVVEQSSWSTGSTGRLGLARALEWVPVVPGAPRTVLLHECCP